MSFRIVSGRETDKWLSKNMRKCTFPILDLPAKTGNDITGSAFLLYYKDTPYVVTAAHVIDRKNPTIAFSTRKRKVVGVKTSDLQAVGLDWIKHPADLDMAAIPLYIPRKLAKDLDIHPIREDAWSSPTRIAVDNTVAHLGYPLRGTSNYSDGVQSAFPQGMPGSIMKIKRLEIVTATAAANGASGGPLFLKRSDGTPYLIGVVVRTKVIGTHANPTYLNETTSLPISLVKDILESKEMEKQYNEIKIPVNWM